MPVVKIEWGIDGLKYALKDNDIIIIVDTIRFSSAVVTAVATGFTIYPATNYEKGRLLADKIGAELAGKPNETKFSLSPLSYLQNAHHPNKKIILPSPNGATCAAELGPDDTGYIGCFLNAAAVARQAQKEAMETDRNITVIAAGEERATEKNGLVYYVRESSERVFAIEDYLGAGAVISYLLLTKNPDARLCETAFKAAKNNLIELLLQSYSGRWLLQNNAQKDLEHLLQMNYYDIVPVINNGKITDMIK